MGVFVKVSLRRNQIRIILDMIWQAEVSLVKGSNQTNHFTNRENRHAPPSKHQGRAIGQSLMCLDLVSFSVLSRTKLQAPLLAVTSNTKLAHATARRVVSSKIWLVHAMFARLDRTLLCPCDWCVGWHAENLPYVRLKRPRVYRQHVHMCKHMWEWCQYTRARFERTHGERERGVNVSSAYQNLLTEGNHVPQRNNKETHAWYFSEREKVETHDTTTHTDTHTQHNDTQQHTTTQHRTHHSAEAKRTEEEMEETKRDRDEKRYKWEEGRGNREKREIEGETGWEREERVLTCIRGSPIENFRILPIQRIWSRTTLARILQSCALLKACHAQPLSRSWYIYMDIKIKINRCTCARIHIHLRSMMCTVRSLWPSTLVSWFFASRCCFKHFRKFQALPAETDREENVNNKNGATTTHLQCVVHDQEGQKKATGQ